MVADEYGYWMKLALGFDLLFNVLTGGEIGVFFSTRSYLNARDGSRKWWVITRNVIDYMFWEGHCKDSYLWERSRKQEWIDLMTKEVGGE